MSDLTQISLGVIIGVGLIVWLLIAAALSDRRRHDTKPAARSPTTMHDIVGIILIALFFASFIGTCASLGRTTQPPPPGPDKPED